MTKWKLVFLLIEYVQLHLVIKRNIIPKQYCSIIIFHYFFLFGCEMNNEKTLHKFLFLYGEDSSFRISQTMTKLWDMFDKCKCKIFHIQNYLFYRNINLCRKFHFKSMCVPILFSNESECSKEELRKHNVYVKYIYKTLIFIYFVYTG